MGLSWRKKSLTLRMAISAIRSTGWFNGYWNHWRGQFETIERGGLHVLPVHYYSPIPHVAQLPDELWSGPRQLTGLQIDLDRAAQFLLMLSSQFLSECRSFPEHSTNPHQFYFSNEAFHPDDAYSLYFMIRHLKPQRIIEIGSGFSTLLISQAVRHNKNDDPNYSCHFTAIEPFPPSYLNPPPGEVTEFRIDEIQKVPLAVFSDLHRNDLLFIDSSHVAKIGSDVVYEYLSILPNLNRDVIVHIHDIFTPFEYPKRWIKDFRFFWNEQYVLEALLSGGSSFEVILPMHALSRLRSELFTQAIPKILSDTQEASSFWMRKM
jgi:hypothetical protein